MVFIPIDKSLKGKREYSYVVPHIIKMFYPSNDHLMLLIYSFTSFTAGNYLSWELNKSLTGNYSVFLSILLSIIYFYNSVGVKWIYLLSSVDLLTL